MIIVLIAYLSIGLFFALELVAVSIWHYYVDLRLPFMSILILLMWPVIALVSLWEHIREG